MKRRQPNVTRAEALFPSPTLCRSLADQRVLKPAVEAVDVAAQATRFLARGDQRLLARVNRVEARLAVHAVEPLDHLRGDVADFLGHVDARIRVGGEFIRSEEHTSELQSLMRISNAVFCLKKKTTQ